jgi:hypothetical protein
MYPICSFCGRRPVVAWFEGPSFRDAVDSADKVLAEEAWLTCQVCLTLVEANDRDGLVERCVERQRRKDRDVGRVRTVSDEPGLTQSCQDRLDLLFWNPRSA